MKENLRAVGNFALIFFLFAVLFSFAMFQGGFTSWFLFFGFLPIFLYHFGLLLYPIHKWEVSRLLSHHVIRAGDGVTATILVRRRIPFPLYYCICEEIFPDTLKKVEDRSNKYLWMDEPERLYRQREIKKVVFPAFRRVIELPYRIEQIPRGEHQLRYVRIKTGDFFGFVKKEHVFQLDDQVIAYPNELPVRMGEVSSSYEQGSVASSALNLTNTNVATGIREYMPGDKVSWIDWKQTARKNEVMTKEFEQEKSSNILLVLDAVNYKGMNGLAFEAAIEVTVSLMEAIRRNSTQVGLVSIGEDIFHSPMQHSPGQREWVRQHLTRIQPSGDHAFAIRLQEEMFKMGTGNIIIAVTTNLDEKLVVSAKKLRQRTKRVSIIFIQSVSMITEKQHAMMQQLRFEGVRVIVLTEKQLVKNPLEVSGI